jgi:S1-C subfamily serine protease
VQSRINLAAAFVLALSTPTAHGQLPAAGQDGPATIAKIEQSVTDAIARVEPGVVAVSRKPRMLPNADKGPDTDAFSELRDPAESHRASTVVACGVIVDPAGLVLTEYLAVREDDDHSITTIEGKTYPAKILAADPRSSLAVLEMTSTASSPRRTDEARNGGPPGSFPALKIADASTLRKGQFVIAIGNPFAIESDGQPTTSWGIVTNLARKAPTGTNLNDAPGPLKDFRTTIHHLGTLIQTDAKLGWSTGGGALVNLRGELIGMTTTAAVIAGHEQPAGYAIPMNATIRRVIDSLKQGREIEYGMLGVGFGPAPLELDPSNRPSLRVSTVYANSPAAQAGLQESDVLTRIADKPVKDIDDVQLAISALPPGAKTTIAYERAGRPATTEVTLAKLAVAGKKIATVRPESWRGMRVDYATTLEAPALTEAISSGAFDEKGCVLVSEVEPESIAWRAGVRPGAFVTHVAGERVSTPDEFRAAVKTLGKKMDLTFTTPLSPEAASERAKPSEE